MNERLAKFLWYYHRLLAMRPAEIAHRLEEAAKRRLSRIRASGWSAFDMGDGPLPALPCPRLADLTLEPSMIARWRTVANATRSGRVTLLGKTWPAGGGAQKWHLDPVTERCWPAEHYCFDIPYRHAHGMGDIKYVWELNRLQHLQPVAALAAHTGDEALATLCWTEIESWIDANPPFFGVNWASGIELALRIVSLLIVISFLKPEAVPARLRPKLRACLAAHAYWLDRYPSRFSSANNHLIAEAGGLFLLGTLWPELKDAGRYAEKGRRILVEEAFRQIHDDGVGAEQSPTYTAFTLEWYLLCHSLTQVAGEPFPDTVRGRLARAGEYLRWITDEGGHQPRIGDDDEGRVIASDEGFGHAYVSSVLGSVSALCGREDIAPPRLQPELRNLLFGVLKPASGSPYGARLFSSGGYTVIRRKFGARRAVMVMDHGPLGYLSIAAHGHADALALWLHLDDMPILVDAGTYLYHAGGAWRDYFRSTPAHNTLCIDGAGSSEPAGAFNWRRKAQSELAAWRENKHGASVTARHDGYRAGYGVWHQRTLSATAEGFTIRDELLKENAARRKGRPCSRIPVDISYLVHPDLDVRADDNAAIISRDGEALLRIAPDKNLALGLAPDGAVPRHGWYSHAFGAKQRAPVLTFRPRDERVRRFEMHIDVLSRKTKRAPAVRARTSVTVD